MLYAAGLSLRNVSERYCITMASWGECYPKLPLDIEPRVLTILIINVLAGKQKFLRKLENFSPPSRIG